MHQVLDGVWHEIGRILVPGGIVCINIGDATRTIQSQFRLYANHARIIRCFHQMGFHQLPTIIWRKTTNEPNKFMGSGMLPPGAYVTIASLPDIAQQIIDDRIQAHHRFVKERMATKRALKYPNQYYGFPVMTHQEQALCFYHLKNIHDLSKNCFSVSYKAPLLVQH